MNAVIGLPQDRAGIYGQAQDWLQAHGIGVYEPHRRFGDGTLFDEWNGPAVGFLFKPPTLAMLRQQSMNMLLHVSHYYYALKPIILRRAMPDLPAMRQALHNLGIKQPWFMIDEPPHSARYGWTQTIENDVVGFAEAAMNAGFEIGVAVPGPSQYAFWEKRISPSWWILHANASWIDYDIGPCWLYNASSYVNLRASLEANHADGYLQWSGVATTVKGPVPILFDETGAPTYAALQLVAELNGPPILTDAEKLARLWAAHPELHT